MGIVSRCKLSLSRCSLEFVVDFHSVGLSATFSPSSRLACMNLPHNVPLHGKFSQMSLLSSKDPPVYLF